MLRAFHVLLQQTQVLPPRILLRASYVRKAQRSSILVPPASEITVAVTTTANSRAVVATRRALVGDVILTVMSLRVDVLATSPCLFIHQKMVQ
ncbi:ORF1157 [White spot syndrome virus]|uniref:ORF1157 n=1 Tax=White spot syndrome virus TaxID=342409 RepID=A0A2D3I5R7_9VIRU|nr:ORF1157 [White spot syndrome virus]